MLYALFEWLDSLYNIPGFGVFQYLTFRAVLAISFSLVLSLIIGKQIIDFLRNKLIGETIRELGPQSHQSKKGTPTMGGIIIVTAIVIPTILWGDLRNAYVLLALIATLWMGIVGFIDDYIKVFKKDKQGLKGKFKIIGQVGLGLIIGLTMVLHPDFQGSRKHLRNDGKIKTNDLLKQAGFQNGDRLIRTDGYTFVTKSQYEIIPYSSYTVARKTEANLIRHHEIKIPVGERQRIAEAIFGNTEPGFSTKTNIPFVKNTTFNYSKLAFWDNNLDSVWGKLIYIFVAIFIVTAVSNGVNITDGLDGLAAGTSAIVASTIGIFAYVSGNFVFARYLNVSFIPQGGELFVFCAALIGACVGFLWYNTYPAQVFMGDTGSLAIGGAIGVLALMVKKELLLPLICGVFFVESLSVIIQVSYFKYTKRKYGEGRRIFKMSPIHHHFELSGMHESKIVTRFWIVTILLEIIAFATLKLR